jgi:hypothetical protein
MPSNGSVDASRVSDGKSMPRPSRNCPRINLRAGTVKARRPCVRAGGAKRSALHGAEHRCSIVVVMAGGVDVHAKGDPSPGAESISNAACGRHGFPHSNWPAHHARTGPVNERHFPDERDRIVPKI